MADSIFPDSLTKFIMLLPPQSCPVGSIMTSSGSGQGDAAVPKWAQALIDSQKELTSQLSAFVVATAGTSGKESKSPPSNNRKRKPSLPHDDDSDDFDSRFGHLFEHGVCDSNYDQDDGLELDDDQEDGNELEYDEEGEGGLEEEDDNTQEDKSEEGGSEDEDEDLIESKGKTPNWKVSSAIKRFIVGVIDRPLPDAVQKQLEGEFIPN